ncbi:MAG: WG repeat-containing protein [Bacteroidetes bacterium]|nr:WG repeat-containing protein [Bacteroidota bacterium]
MKKILFSILLFTMMFSTFGQDQKVKKNVESSSKKKIYQIESNGLYGFVDANGKEIIKPKFETVDEFGERRKDWALVLQDGLYGFINNEGLEVVKPKYDAIAFFGEYHEDWAMVIKDGLIGFINTQGIEVVKPQYDAVNLFGEYYYKWALVEKDGLFGFIDNKGVEVVKPKYDYFIRGNPLTGFFGGGNQEDIEFK